MESKKISAIILAAVLTLGSMGVYAAAFDPNETVVSQGGDTSSAADESSSADSFVDGSSENDGLIADESSQTDDSHDTDSSQADDSSAIEDNSQTDDSSAADDSSSADSKPDGPEVNEDDFITEDLTDGTVKIIGYSGGKDVVIPKTLGGKPVTVIGVDAFSEKNLDTLVIPDSVTTIEDYAFWACGLKKITFGSGLTSVGEGAFMYLDDLEEIHLPDSLVSIGNWAFANCKTLAELDIPDGCKSVGEGAFACCYKLAEITIPKTVDNIGNLAFGYFDRDDQNYCKLENFSLNVYADTAGEKYAEENDLIHKVYFEVAGTAVINSKTELDSDGITLTVFSDEDICRVIVDEENFCVENLLEGSYYFTFSAKNCPDRTYEVKVEKNMAEFTAELCLYGDVNGDSIVTTADVGLTNADARGIKSLSEYSEKCADVNGDGKISTADVGMVNAHTRKTKALW